MKKRALIAGLSGKEVAERIAKILEKKYNVEVYYPKPKGFYFKGIKKALKTRKKPLDLLILITSGSNLRLYPFFRLVKSKQKIFFPYDITYFYRFNGLMKILNFIERNVEKQIFLRCDKIIHKGLENELSFLPFYNRIKDKPAHLFREFINPELVQEYDPSKKLSNKDGEIHLVYVGGLYLKDRPETESFWKFHPKLTNQGLHLHIYSKVHKEVESKFKEIEKKDRFFHYEGFKDHKTVIKELTKYDWGIHIFGRENLSIPKEKIINIVGFSNKDFDYLSAGLPIIVSDELRTICNFVKQNHLGLCISYKNLDKLKKKLIKRKNSFPRTLNSIKKYQKNVNTFKFEDFIYEKNNYSWSR